MRRFQTEVMEGGSNERIHAPSMFETNGRRVHGFTARSGSLGSGAGTVAASQSGSRLGAWGGRGSAARGGCRARGVGRSDARRGAQGRRAWRGRGLGTRPWRAVQGSGIVGVGCCRAWRAAEREIGRERREIGERIREEREWVRERNTGRRRLFQLGEGAGGLGNRWALSWAG
jgi:hypothetical protein